MNHYIKKVNNVALAKAMDLHPATVLEMVRKLADKKLIQFLPDKTIQLTDKGRTKALHIIRKHRLWEDFLVRKLKYKWNEVHELAEQLEHIESEDLINRLEEFLEFPPFDPHGDPIPDKQGKIRINNSIPLLSCQKGKSYMVKHFAETNDAFLDYLSKLNMIPGSIVKIIDLHTYDQSLNILISKKTIQVSEKVAKNILVQPCS